MYLMVDGSLLFVNGEQSITLHHSNHLILTVFGVTETDCMNSIHKVFGWRPYYPNVPMNYTVAPICKVLAILRNKGVEDIEIDTLFARRQRLRKNEIMTVKVYQRVNGTLVFTLEGFKNTIDRFLGSVTAADWIGVMKAVHIILDLPPYVPIDREMSEERRRELDRIYYEGFVYKPVKKLLTNRGTFVYPLKVELFQHTDGFKRPYIPLRDNTMVDGNIFLKSITVENDDDLNYLKVELGLAKNDQLTFL